MTREEKIGGDAALEEGKDVFVGAGPESEGAGAVLDGEVSRPDELPPPEHSFGASAVE